MPRLAIVIPAVGKIELLEGTLVSVLENRPADCEIVVALNRPYADPYELRDEVRFVEAPPRASIVAAINQALSATRAPFVHLLAAGCEVSEGWADRALTRFGDRQVACVVPLALDENRDHIFAAGVGYRRGGRRYLIGQGLAHLAPELRGAIVGPAGFAAFYRKTALELAGGLSAQLGQRQFDVDLALVFRRVGLAAAIEHDSIVYAKSEVEPAVGAFGQALRDERLFWRNLAAPSWPLSLVEHAGVVALELLGGLGRPRMLTQVAGRALACCQIGNYARHHRAVEQFRRAVRPRRVAETRIDRSHATTAPTESAASHHLTARSRLSGLN